MCQVAVSALLCPLTSQLNMIVFGRPKPCTGSYSAVTIRQDAVHSRVKQLVLFVS